MNPPEPRETNHEWFCDRAKGLTGECNCDQNKDMNAPTPETDAFCCENNSLLKIDETQLTLLRFARKLERECNEVRDANRRANELIGNQAQENDKINSTLQAELVQLRKVCDDMASEKCKCALCMENDLVLNHYSTLPHRQLAKGTK